MPEISRFFGISVYMHFNDHAPPHFHVYYGDQSAAIGIDPIRLLKGHLSPRVFGLAAEWAIIHQQELMDNWNRARLNQSPFKILPLE